MKKIILISIISLLTNFSTSYASDQCSPHSYDVNHDHKTTATDALIVLRSAVGLGCKKPSDDTTLITCSPNMEELYCVDSDYQCIIRYESGTYCCEGALIP